mmetsp:Transcript_27152/g.50895  ORF Transcript_27152/g.50895 Transcript_27152/m.50895 type:complete len:648 (-) Transcript_27152:1256-3199(-)
MDLTLGYRYSKMDNQDLFNKLGNEQQDGSPEQLMGDLGDPFNDSAGPDLFEKLMEDSALKSVKSSGSLASNNSFVNNSSANNIMFDSGLNAEDLLHSALNKSENSLLNANDMETDNNNNLLKAGSSAQNQPWDIAPSLSAVKSSNELPSDWFQSKQPPATSMNAFGAGTALDAAPLNISLGGMGGDNSGFSSSMRRKGSNVQLNSLKMSSVHKASKSSSGFKSSKSEGLLARALKARYNSSGQLHSAYSVNAEQAAAIAQASSRGGSNALLNHSPSLNAVGSGAKNASWRAPDRTSSSSMIQQMLLNRNRSSSKLQSCDSTTAMFSAKLKLGPSKSKSSMQDLLRLSRKQSKTQSMLRQSSAQSLAKQTSSTSLRESSGKVDVSSLLPPEHANARRGLGSSLGMPNGRTGLAGGHANATFPANNYSSNASAGANMETESLLHQSCRLYPTTDTVVELALKTEPDSVRKAVATAVEQGSSKKPSSIYGYPINVALTHGASMGVLRMLAQAGPDVLVQKDGTDGSGSLGVALSAKCGLDVVNLLIQVNPECARVADRRGNYPLHVAVSQGLSLQIVKRIFSVYPKAQDMRNFHSNTPLDIAQRSTRCPEEVMNFLQSSAYSKLENFADHIDQNPGNLEEGLDDIMQTNL